MLGLSIITTLWQFKLALTFVASHLKLKSLKILWKASDWLKKFFFLLHIKEKNNFSATIHPYGYYYSHSSGKHFVCANEHIVEVTWSSVSFSIKILFLLVCCPFFFNYFIFKFVFSALCFLSVFSSLIDKENHKKCRFNAAIWRVLLRWMLKHFSVFIDFQRKWRD